MTAAGSATINAAGNTLTVQQNSNRAIINWNGFSIGANETTKFIQPGANAAILNRVTGGDISKIEGQLQSNGRVYLLNPNGIVVGPEGKIDTGAFIASTLHVSDATFMGTGSITFDGDSKATIVNLGIIRASSGDVVLIATAVSNQGAISAPQGNANIASGGEVLYSPDGGDILIKAPASVQPAGPVIDNKGTIEAASIALKAAGTPYAMAVNLDGQISATSFQDRGGKVVLDAGDGDAVVSGAVTASAGNTGGAVQITANRIAVTDTASIDASGVAGGGTINIGGGAHGADAAIRNAEAVTVESGARITANATDNGDGGTVVVWGDKNTNYAGHIEAKGGANGGAGGSAEVSGRALQFTGTADLTAPKGKTGTLLLDPDSIGIVAGNTPLPQNATDGFWSVNEDPGAQTISAGAIDQLLDVTSLELDAKTSITVDAALSSSGGNFFTLAAPTITVNADISLPNTWVGFNGETDEFQNQNLIVHLGNISGAGNITANRISLHGFDNVDLTGVVTIDSSGIFFPAVQVQNGTHQATSFSMANSANQLVNVMFGDGSGSLGNYSGDVDVANGNSALTLEGNISGGGHITVVSGGDLQLSSADVFATQFSTSGGQITLASTGGAFKNGVGATVLTGTGRRVIYTSTDASGYTDGGLGYATANFVTYANDPNSGTSHIIYVATPSGLTPMTITADSFIRLYGEADPTFTAHYTGGTASDLTSPVQFTIQGIVDTNAGTYTIVPFGAASSIHTLSYVNGTLTVNPAPLLITADNASRQYGTGNPAFTFHGTGFVNSDTEAVVSGVQFAVSADATSNVGIYAITPSGGTASNYTISYATGNLTVTQAPLVLIGNLTSREYGANDPTLNFHASGLLNGDTESVVSGVNLTTDATAASSVGTYHVIVSGGAAQNYALSYQTGDFVIVPAPLTITANNATRQYGASDPSFTYSVTGLKNGDSASLVSGVTITPSATITSSAGNYTLTPSGGSANSNYFLDTYAPGTLTITKAPLTITANNASRVYGGTEPSFSFSASGLKNGDSASIVTGVTFISSDSANSGVGNYTITPQGGSATNYDFSYVAGFLTVNKASLTITANDAARHYGAADPSFSAQYSGLVLGDTSAVVSGLTLTPTATISSPVGAYFIKPGNATAANYAINYVDGHLSVTPQPVTIFAIDASRMYGDANPLFTYGATGLVNGDTALSLQQNGVVTFATSAGVNSSVGIYPVAPSGGGNGNYVISYASGNLTVTKAPLTVTALASKTYGDTALYSQGNLQITGLRNGDTPFVLSGITLTSTGTVATASAGDYTLVVTGGVAANYAINDVNGTLIVSRAPVFIVADDKSWNIGTAIPPLTFTVSGLKNGDPQPPVTGVVLSQDGTKGVYDNFVKAYVIEPGDFPITVDALGATILNGNYVIVGKAAGTFHVLPINVTSTAPIVLKDVPPTEITLVPPDPPIKINLELPVLGVSQAARPVVDDALDAYLKAHANDMPPPNLDYLKIQLIKGDSGAVAALLPFMYAELQYVLKLDDKTWTDAQRAFVNDMLNLVQQQREEAAQNAKDGYYANKQKLIEAENAKVADDVNRTVVSAYYQPPIDPTYLAVAKSGTYVSATNVSYYSDVLEKVAEQYGDDSATGKAETALDYVATVGLGVGAVGVPLSGAGKVLLTPGVKKFFFPNGKKGEYLAEKRAEKANGMEDAMENGGTEEEGDAVEGKQGARANRTNAETGEGAESAGEGAEVAETTTADTGAAVKTGETTAEAAAEAAAETGEIIAESTEGAAEVVAEVGTGVLEGALDTGAIVLGTAAVPLMAIGGIAAGTYFVVNYVNTQDYENALQQAVNDAKKPVSVADLKALLSTESGEGVMFNYMAINAANDAKPFAY